MARSQTPGDRLRMLMKQAAKKRDQTLKQALEIIGISYSYFDQICNGDRSYERMAEPKKRAMAAYLDCELSDLDSLMRPNVLPQTGDVSTSAESGGLEAHYTAACRAVMDRLESMIARLNWGSEHLPTLALRLEAARTARYLALLNGQSLKTRAKITGKASDAEAFMRVGLRSFMSLADRALEEEAPPDSDESAEGKSALMVACEAIWDAAAQHLPESAMLRCFFGHSSPPCGNHSNVGT